MHHIPYLYNRLGQPWKTQKWTRFICANAYKNKVARLNGKDYTKCHIDYCDIMAGGELELILGSRPNREWGVEDDGKIK